MEWEFDSHYVGAHSKVEKLLEVAKQKGAKGWELVNVTGVIGKGNTSGGRYISVTVGYRFFFKRLKQE